MRNRFKKRHFLGSCKGNSIVMDTPTHGSSFSEKVEESHGINDNSSVGDNCDSPGSSDGEFHEVREDMPDDTFHGTQAGSSDVEENIEDSIDIEEMKKEEEHLSDEQKKERREVAQTLKSEGNALFKEGNYDDAAVSYTRALRICPLSFKKERAILYSNRAACNMKQDCKKAAINDCSEAIELHPQYVRPLARRAQLYEETEKLDEALSDFTKVLELDPLHKEAIFARRRLPGMIEERNEKLKTEMLGKLKDLGNMILKPFGLSTNNFQVNQDPSSGGYSINFKQNPS